MRRTGIGANIVRRGGVLAPRPGQLESRKQTTDNRQTGANQPDGRLDVRPQRSPVDGVCLIGRVNPEQNDDAVDTGETDEDTEGEDAVERELILPRTLQVPDHGDGEGEDDEVDDDVEDLVGDEEFVLVETGAVDGLVPEGVQGTALYGAGDDDGETPGADESVEGEGDVLEFGGGENATVEADDGGFDGWADEEVAELVCDEYLSLFLLVCSCSSWSLRLGFLTFPKFIRVGTSRSASCWPSPPMVHPASHYQYMLDRKYENQLT